MFTHKCQTLKKYILNIQNILNNINKKENIIELKEEIKEINSIIQKIHREKDIMTEIYHSRFLQELKTQKFFKLEQNLYNSLDKIENLDTSEIGKIDEYEDEYELYKFMIYINLLYIIPPKIVREKNLEMIMKKIYGNNYIYHQGPITDNLINQFKQKIKSDNLNAIMVTDTKYNYITEKIYEKLDKNFVEKYITRLSQIHYLELNITGIEKQLIDQIVECRGSLTYLPVYDSTKKILEEEKEILEYKNLKYILGSLTIYLDVKLITPNLEFVLKDLDIQNVKKFEAKKLKNIGANLLAKSATEFITPKLYEVGWTMDVSNATHLELKELRYVGNDLHANKAQIFIAPNLEDIGKKFFLPDHFRQLIEEEYNKGKLQNNDIIDVRKNNRHIIIKKNLYEKLRQQNRLIWIL